MVRETISISMGKVETEAMRFMGSQSPNRKVYRLLLKGAEGALCFFVTFEVAAISEESALEIVCSLARDEGWSLLAVEEIELLLQIESAIPESSACLRRYGRSYYSEE